MKSHRCINAGSLLCRGELSMRKWTKESAQAYIKQAKEKGLTYWSAVDYLKHHKTMHSIV